MNDKLNVVEFLTSIEVVLNEEQIKEINKSLRFKKQSSNNTKVYIRTEIPTTNVKLNKQMKCLVDNLTSEGYTEDEWIISLVGKLETKQDPKRIITYYKRNLIQLGLIEEKVA